MPLCFTPLLFLLQVTSALAYLHSPTEVGIVHRDLKNGNILVFRFPDMDHMCFGDGGEGSVKCDVFVKLTDMGVCANPLAYSAKALGGLRQFVPECVTNKASGRLTEKVSHSFSAVVCGSLVSSSGHSGDEAKSDPPFGKAGSKYNIRS